MSWLQNIALVGNLPWLSDRTLNALADELADQCFSEVWRRAGRGATQTSASVARGYIAARAGEVVAREVDAELAHRPARLAQRREELIERTTESVVALVQRDVAAIATLADLTRAA
jgi:hypothetical protein